jgi:hypothetical protein
MIMTVKEARELLGDEAKVYTDEQVKQIIADTTFLADLAIDSYKKEKLKSPNERD